MAATQSDQPAGLGVASSGRTGTHPGWALVAVLAIAVLALALRVYRLGEWPLADDEIYTLRDSRIMDVFRGPKPLIFFLNYHLFGPEGLNELTMRVVPAVFGVLSVPVVYWVVGRLSRPAVGVVAALLVAVHPEHVYWSQFARYYSLTFTLAAFYPFALYWGVRGRHLGWIAAGVIAAGVAGLGHPSAVLPLGGVALWGAYELWRARGRSGGGYRWVFLLSAVVAAAVLAYFLPILRDWFEMPERFGFGSIGIQLSHLNALGPGLVIAWALGALWLLVDPEDRSLGLLLLLLALIPSVFLAFVALFASAYTGYLWPASPVFFVSAALFLGRCWERGGGNVGARLATAGLFMVLLAGPVPSLMSQYMDGGRHDFRSPATVILEAASPGDVVFADQHELSLHYLGGAEGLSFDGFRRDPDELADTLAGLTEGGSGDDLWIVAEFMARGGFGDKSLEEAGPWVRANCREWAVFGAPRLDFKVNETRLYRCPAAGIGITSAEGAGA